MPLPPDRKDSSLEMTAVRPRPTLDDEPASTTTGPSIEQLADIERARRDAQDEIPTLVPCPGCAGCRVCGDERMVSAERASAWKRGNPEPPPEAA